MQADYDWIAGRKRSQLPGAAVRSIPFAGVVLGCAVSFLMSGGFLWGIFLGGAAGMVVYQVVAHKLQP